MRLLLIANSSWNIYNFRAGLLRRLLADEHEVHVLAPRDASSGALAQMGCVLHDLTIDSKGVNPANDAMLFLRILRAYKEITPDLALQYTIKPVIYGGLAARVTNTPVINVVTGLGSAFISEDWRTRVVKSLYRLSQRRVSRLLFLNRDDMAVFRDAELAPLDVLEVMQGGEGIDLSQYPPTEAYPGDTMPTFLLIARLLRDKGIREYVAAARMLKEEFPEARFQVLGPAGVANPSAISPTELKGWMAEGAIEYLGATSDVRPHIAAAHCVVLPSYREGIPRSLLEACSMMRPIIATDTAGCREVVDEGANGFLCQVRDVQTLADAMRKFILMSPHERAQMGQRGREKVEREFDERHVIRRYLDLMSSMRRVRSSKAAPAVKQQRA